MVSRLDRLIKELCPNGVEYSRLKECTEMKRGTSATKSTLVEGNIPVISGGKEPAFYCDSSNRDGETITVAGSGAGAGYVQYWNKPIFVNDAFSIKGNEKLYTRYVYHYLLSIQGEIYGTKKGGGVPHVHISSIENFKIPLPPLAVQCEIVRILDNFTELTAKLTAELTARKKQYEYYRNKLLTFGDEVEWKTLGDIGTIIRGNGLQKSDFSENGIRCIHYGQIYTYYGMIAKDTKSFVAPEVAKKLKKVSTGDIIIAITSENVEDVCKCAVWLGKEDIVTGGHTAIFKHNQNAKYIAYYLQTEAFFEQKRRIAHGTKVIEVSPKKLEKIKIPVPPLSEQERIVSILDKFDALVNDISIGLPAEIQARQKQYEYYRDKLLSFKEAANEQL